MSLGKLTESRIGLLVGLSVCASRRRVLVICDCVDCWIVRNGLLLPLLGLNALQTGALAIAAAITADMYFILCSVIF